MEAGRRHTGPHLPRLPWSLTVERRGAPVHELDKFPGRCLHRLLAGPTAHGHLAEGALRFLRGLGPLIYLSFGNSPSQSPRSDRSKAQTSASAPFLTEGLRCRASSQPTNQPPKYHNPRCAPRPARPRRRAPESELQPSPPKSRPKGPTSWKPRSVPKLRARNRAPNSGPACTKRAIPFRNQSPVL